MLAHAHDTHEDQVHEGKGHHHPGHLLTFALRPLLVLRLAQLGPLDGDVRDGLEHLPVQAAGLVATVDHRLPQEALDRPERIHLGGLGLMGEEADRALFAFQVALQRRIGVQTVFPQILFRLLCDRPATGVHDIEREGAKRVGQVVLVEDSPDLGGQVL